MILHAGFFQQNVTHKEIALEDSAAVHGKCRLEDGKACAKPLHESVRDRADIALACAVEG